MKLEIQKLKSLFREHQVEFWSTVVLLAVIIFFHAQVLHFGGGLWRDESSSAALASRSFTAGIHDDLMYDSFPPASTVIFHLWSQVSDSDLSFRILGFVIGLAILVAFLFDSYLLRIGVPFLSLLLFEFNAIAIHYGDSIRPYGLGIFFILMTFGLVWKLAIAPENSWRLFALTLIFAILSVQTMYQNAFLVMAICLGGIAVVYVHKNYRRMLEITVIGLLSGLSLVFYGGFIRHASDWSSIAKDVYNPSAIGPMITAMLGPTWIITILGLGFLILGAVIKFIVLQTKNNLDSNQKDLFNFSIVVLLAGSISYSIFMVVVRVPSQIWYFIPLLALVAICSDIIFKVFITNPKLQKKILVLALIGFLFFSVSDNFHFLKNRYTNVDLIADFLVTNAHERDLVLVNPWQVGVSFNRYYHGRSAWSTLPTFSDISIFHYDIMKDKMAQANPTQENFDAMQKTLQSGAKLWVVGTVQPDNPAANPPTGGYMVYYIDYWTQQLQQFLDQHAQNRKVIDLNIQQPINSFEDFQLRVFQGWKE